MNHKGKGKIMEDREWDKTRYGKVYRQVQVNKRRHFGASLLEGHKAVTRETQQTEKVRANNYGYGADDLRNLGMHKSSSICPEVHPEKSNTEVQEDNKDGEMVSVTMAATSVSSAKKVRKALFCGTRE